VGRAVMLVIPTGYGAPNTRLVFPTDIVENRSSPMKRARVAGTKGRTRNADRGHASLPALPPKEPGRGR
jgi:hypothetical protein